MPAQGRGANLDTSRRIGAPRRKQPTPTPAPAAAPTTQLSGLSGEPFKPAQQAAQRKVVGAQRALAPVPTPKIPRISNPTPAQTKAALQLAHESQTKAIGPKPTAARIQAYQRELRNDPRQADYVKTVEHYAHAAQEHVDELVGRIHAGGGENVEDALAPEAVGLSRKQAVAIGRQLRSQPQATAKPAPAPHGLSLPLLGTIIPGSTVAGVEGAVASKAAEDLPSIEGVGRAVKDLATGNVSGGVGPNHSLIHNAVIDLAQLPAGTISSLVQTGKAGVEAVAGKPKALGTLGKSLLQVVDHPLKALHERPVSTALTLAGGEELAGHAAGALARTGALGDAASAAAATARPDLELYNDMAVKRTYNPDVVRKGAQVAAEKVRASKLTPESRRQLDPNQATGVRLEKAIRGTLTRPGEVDVNVAGAEQVRRQLRGDMTKSIRSAKPKSGADAVPLIVERVLRGPTTVDADLQREATRLQRGQEGLTGADLEQNKDSLARVEALRADKRFLANPAPAFDAAEHYIAATKPLAESLQRVGHLPPQAATRAPLFPYAIAHMGARYFSVADHAALETAARGEEARASALVQSTPAGSPERDAAVQLAQRARAARYAVSGRGSPEGIVAHEQTIEAHAAARAAVPRAENDLRRAEAARARLVGAQRVQRAADGTRAATREEEDRLAAATAKVDGRREALGAAKRQVGVARDAAASSHLPKTIAGLRHGDGSFLPTEEIRAHMTANGVGEPGYLSQESGVATDRGSFFKSTSRRPAASKTRTGESFRKGTYDRTYDALIAQGSKLANDYAAHHATDARLSRFGIGRFANDQDAAAEAENFSHTPEGERITDALGPLVPTPIGRERVRAAGRVHPGDVEETRDRFGVQAHKDVEGAETPLEGKFTLLPKAVVDRLNEHDKLLGPSAAGKLGQIVTNRYRQTALFTSPRWLLGNPQEHGIRLALAGAAPKFIGGRAGRFGAKLDKAYTSIALEKGLDGEAARLARSELIGRGTHYGAAEDAKIYRASDQFQSSPLLGPTMHGSETASGSRVGRALLKPWHSWHDVVSNGMVHLETESRRAALGKAAISDIHRFNGKWTNVLGQTDAAVKAYARGTLKPAQTAFLVKQVDEMMGAYGHLTPVVRQAVQSWSPFGLWWLTSMRYLRRLPIDHPTKTAILAALHNAVASTEPPGQETPGYLEGGIHVKLPLGLGGATLQPTYYSPAGVAIEPLQTAASLIAPLQTELVGAGLGLNTFTGKPLTAAQSKLKENEASEGQRPEIIASKLLSNLVPGIRQIEQLQEKGGTPYDTSNIVNPAVKPGTQRDLAHALLKVLSPARFTYDQGAGRGGSEPANSSPRRQRAISRSSRSSAFDTTRRQRALERSERR